LVLHQTDFTTHFSFIINSFNNSLYGDGLAFFLAPYPSVLPNFLSGSNLGLFSQESAHSASSNTLVAVEFDTFQNEWDPSPDHVGVNINSIESVATRMWKTSIKDGQIANAWVSYKANTKNLSVFLTYKEKPVFHGNSSLSYAVDLKEILSDKVAIGFSASTGHATEIHNLLLWEFSSTLVAKMKSKVGLLVRLGGSMGAAMVVLGLVRFILRRKKMKRLVKEEEFEYDVTLDNEFEQGRGPKRFSFRELVDATTNFAKELKLGEGGFGEVYKEVLNASKLEVAIKRYLQGQSKVGRSIWLKLRL